MLLMLGLYLLPMNALSQQFGKSFVNITKGTIGGTYEPGDILEIRATVAVGNNLTLSQFRFVDTISSNATYIAGSLKILTNEGLVFRSYSDAANDDAAMYDGATQTVRINMGSSVNGVMGGSCGNTDPADVPDNGGTIVYNGRPSFYNATCIMSASYRIQINPALPLGSGISLNGGGFYYRMSASGTDFRSRIFSSYSIALSSNIGLCSNAIGANAVLDNGGTFGSGDVQNRTASAIVAGYAKQNISSSDINRPNDGEYAIVNNLSPSGTTNTAAPYSGGNRVFNAWDITGDHTSAASESAGNAPVAPGTTGGYFVVVNASYANGEAFQQPVSGLCGNTYYEFSAWFKNVCSRCACDSVGRGSTNGSFNGPDPAGVLPNLTFEIDGTAYYSTGNITYSGNWVKKGFIFKTSPGQTSFTLTIRNNAPGGGGNDWAIDDITFGTCSPELNFNPSPIASVCANAQAVELKAIVSSYFDNYRYWRWERSTDEGANWSNTGEEGSSTPVNDGTNHTYQVDYPPFIAGTADSGHLYRLRIATSATNLNNSCSFADGTNILTLQVTDCTILPVEIKHFTAQLRQQKAVLHWQALNASPGTILVVEKSTNNHHFREVGQMAAGTQTAFQWNDPEIITGATYYRIRIAYHNLKAYSMTTMVNKPDGSDFIIRGIQNPFVSSLEMELATQKSGQLQLLLTDLQGRVVRQQEQLLSAGVQKIAFTQLAGLPKGIYVLKIRWNDEVYYQRVVK